MIRSRDIFLDYLQSKPEQQPEEEAATAYYCGKCCINWGVLETQTDDAGDEQYEVCPACKTDSFLFDGEIGDRYIHFPLSGQIINMRTREELKTIKPVDIPVKKPRKPFNQEAWLKKREEREQKELNAIDAYQQAYEQGGREAAEMAYFTTFNHK